MSCIYPKQSVNVKHRWHVEALIISSINPYKVALSHAPRKFALDFCCFATAIRHIACTTSHKAVTFFRLWFAVSIYSRSEAC
jgi:hypothetical protein